MTKDLIYRVYNYDTHKGSDEPNSISATTIIGGAYKAKLALEKVERDSSFVDNQFKRSSTLGTAFHSRCEEALKDDPSIEQELYRELPLYVDGVKYTVTGSCDILQEREDGTWDIGDWKTGYGKEYKGLETTAKQLSIYRWLLAKEYNINDTGYVLFVSVSNNNAEKAYPIELMSIDATQDYIEARIDYIVNNEKVDCGDSTYNSCNYCDFVCAHRQ